MTTRGGAVLRRTVRWGFYILIPLQLFPLWNSAAVLKGSLTAARFSIVNHSPEPFVFTPVGHRGLRLFSRVVGFPALQVGNFRLAPGEEKTFSYYCTGGGLAQFHIRTDDGQERQFSKALIKDDCAMSQPKQYEIDSVGSLPHADPELLEAVGTIPPSGIHPEGIRFYAELSLPLFLLAFWLLKVRLDAAKGEGEIASA